jgi:phosphate-selective porin
MKPLPWKFLTASALCLGATTSLHANDHATDARLRALEHELGLLRTELASEKAANSQLSQRATDFVAGEMAPLPPLDPIDDDAIFVQPKQSAVTELKVRGRMHYQFGYSSADESGYSDYSTHEFRRLRLGASGKLLDDWKFELQGNILPDSSSTSLHSAYIDYTGWDGLNLSFHKDRPRFGAELKTSSSNIKTVERSNLSNLVDPKQITGMSLAGDMGIFNWQVGSYNGELGRNQETTDLGNEGVPEYAVNASLGVDLSEVVGVDRFAMRLDYIYNSDDDDLGSNALNSYEDLIAASIDFGIGGFSIAAEYIQADLHNDGDLSGFWIMPSLMLTEKLEAVVRYENIEAEDGATIRHQSRYARRNVASDVGTTSLGSIRGEEYWAVYGGLNYYINKSVKLMFGAEYADLDDTNTGDSISAITGFSALRLEF